MMCTVALRFAENFAPSCGTIAAHQALIERNGMAWYGKLGAPISNKIADKILANDESKILLIHSGGQSRWWAHIDQIQRGIPPFDAIPEYYRSRTSDFGCWFRVRAFEAAKKNIMASCIVASSGKTLSAAPRYSMSPYFIINCPD